ncbi:hypothetical protein BAUCODRAFT_344806 [Baudoinia panamericana UAMH 10762]|uniref:Uncharacterized protein n=1 Tax=Baudoinia panamericana (strain UAMH 10762) TaxID=717646 RepID=M2NJR1_BAUPA|nr:uncharacterized protein BAUCODRAFT_344806 [Baudoinia panamericana UAMH 10762]EMC99654.1 hypothetical protein BAUCODRAFT_344806 [Baudoinia panamericana UAMH 10762]
MYLVPQPHNRQNILPASKSRNGGVSSVHMYTAERYGNSVVRPGEGSNAEGYMEWAALGWGYSSHRRRTPNFYEDPPKHCAPRRTAWDTYNQPLIGADVVFESHDLVVQKNATHRSFGVIRGRATSLVISYTNSA